VASEGNHIHLRQAQRAIWADVRLSSSEKHVGIYMLNRMRDDYTGAFPNVQTICTDVGLHRATVLNSLSKLVEIGWFIRRPMGRKRSYSVSDIEFMVNLATQHRDAEKVAQDDLSPTKGRPERQVARNDRSSRTTRQVAQNDLSHPESVVQDDTDRLKVLSAHLSAQEGVATSATNPPFAGANSSDDKSGEQHKAVDAPSEGPPSPQAGVVPAMINAPSITQALPAGFGADLNNLNPHAASIRQNRRYGALTMLDGSEGVLYDIQLGKLTLVNGTLAHFEQEAKARGLDLSAALVKAAVKVAKDPRNATPTMVCAEINQALAYQEQDKRKAPSSAGIKINRGWGRKGIRGF
jgi:hypothetical protein